MDQQTFLNAATTVSKLKLFPYFDIAHYVLMCLIIREDTPQMGSKVFSRKHPFASWASSMLLCFGGSVLGNALLGEMPITPLKNHDNVLIASAVWYVINYSPFDIAFRILKLLPVRVIVCCMKEVQRTRKIYDGVGLAWKKFPNAYLIVLIIGTINGCATLWLLSLTRWIHGKWMPHEQQFLLPNFTTKAAFAGALIFMLEKMNWFPTIPHVIIYFGVVVFLVYFRLSVLLIGISDPFLPFENLFCAVFMGGMLDALQRVRLEDAKTTDNGAVANGTKKTDTVKNREDKKKD